MQSSFLNVIRAAAFGAALVSAGSASAGTLAIQNKGRFPIACTADGWTTGTTGTKVFIAPSGGEIRIDIAPSDTDKTLGWLQCGGVLFPQLKMTADGPDRTLVLTGLQTRALKVALYPYLPTDPTVGFGPLLAHVVATYQQQNPQVVLDAVMTDVGIYDFGTLPPLLQAGGYDVMELDMLYLGFLAEQKLLNPAALSQQTALPVSTAAATYNGVLYGIPSWLCMDFLFTNDTDFASVTSLDALVATMPRAPNGGMALVGDFNGSWRLPSIYLNAFVQRYGYGSIAKAFDGPIDPATIGDLKTLTTQCATVTLTGNPCINGTIHKDDGTNPGASERIFAAGSATADIGFSERSYFIAKAGQPIPTTIIPVPWGNNPQSLLFADSFVTSAANCATGSPCATDATAFTDMMTGLPMRNYIVQAQDLGNGSPWRTLLVSNAAFYQQPEIMNNRLYQQVSKVFEAAQPIPNQFTAQAQTDMAQGVCRGLKAVTTYECKTGANVPAPIAGLQP